MTAAGCVHRGLARQLRRLGLSADALPDDLQAWRGLLDAVSLAYQEADEERYTLERSLEVSTSEMRALHDKLSHRARHDTLTGLPNRAALKEILQAELGERRRSGHTTAVLFIDLDGFKLVNDSLGHAVGDDLLIRAAERICAVIRPGDVAARLGGDEFVVLCPQVDDLDDATSIAHRIGDRLQEPFRLSGHETASVSASIGIALAGDRTGADELLANADLAMYEAKTGGRARCTVFDDAMREQVESRMDVESALWHAVDHDELALHFQPIVDLADHRITAAEALVRWQRPGRGLLPAPAFVPIAEQSRLITLIDAWVLREACRQAVGWPDPLGVSVNLSTRDVRGDHFLPTLSAVLHDSGLDPHRLTLELTETALMSDPAAATAVLSEADALGVSCAIDDFGTGYWSMTHLRHLPVRTLKIDQSLAADVLDDPACAAIVGAIAAMGRALGLRIVAEGIESAAQAERLAELGCDGGQGYWFAVPRPGTPMLGTIPAPRSHAG
jgi:diguanylate cyclase (GGDEF)-like protein